MYKIFSALLVLIFLQSCLLPPSLDMQTNTITSHGTSEIKAKPDIATFSFTLREEAADVKIAQQKMSEKAIKALNLLKNNGVKNTDIKTTNYSSYPKYSYVAPVCKNEVCQTSKQVISGYEASETFFIKVRDAAKTKEVVAGEILTDIAKLEITEVSGLSFEVEDVTKIKAKAKAEAIAKAKEDARMIAENLGVTLGKIVGFSEENSGGYFKPNYFRGLAVSAMAETVPSVTPPVESGEQKITSSVSITYRIK